MRCAEGASAPLDWFSLSSSGGTGVLPRRILKNRDGRDDHPHARCRNGRARLPGHGVVGRYENQTFEGVGSTQFRCQYGGGTLQNFL